MTSVHEDHYVAFLDILGYGSHIKDNWDEDPHRIITLLKNLHTNFTVPGVQGKERSEDGKSTIYRPRIQVISDSIIVSIRIGSEESSLAELTSLLATCAYIWNYLLYHGFSLRGGISHGTLYADENLMTGKAVIEAYEIENNIAISSRVVIQDTIVDLIETQIPRHLTSAIPNELNKYITTDTDGYSILDPKAMGLVGPMHLDESPTEASVISAVRSLQNQHPSFAGKYNPLMALIIRP